PALVMPPFPPSDATHERCRLGHQNARGRQHGAGLMKGGSRMFNVSARVGAGLVCAAIVTLLSGGSGLAREKDPSDNSVRMFIRYAWQLLPEKFTSPSGKTIVIDKKKPKEVELPFEVAREAVRVGYYSAQAQLCDMLEDQAANYRTLM